MYCFGVSLYGEDTAQFHSHQAKLPEAGKYDRETRKIPYEGAMVKRNMVKRNVVTLHPIHSSIARPP